MSDTVSAMTFRTLTELNSSLKDERRKIRSLIKKNWSFKFVRGRGLRLIAVGKGDRVVDPCEWNGTLKEITKLISEVESKGATEIFLEGGFDGSDSFDFGEYQPEIEGFEILIWLKATPCKHCGLPTNREDHFCTDLHRNEFDRVANELAATT
jgi:hypothetical protein